MSEDNMTYEVILELWPGKEQREHGCTWDYCMLLIEDYHPHFEVTGSDEAGLWVITDFGRPVGEMIPDNEAGRKLNESRLSA